jgi:hypothetical protein
MSETLDIDIKHEGLANQYRGPAPHYRSAAKSAEHLWFIPELKGDFWSCMACPLTEEQARKVRFRWMMDGFFSANRLEGKAKQRREVHHGRSGLMIPNEKVRTFIRDNADLQSSTCGNHKSNKSGSTGASRSNKDVTAVFGCVCSHGMMAKLLCIQKSGEKFNHGALIIETLLQEQAWLKKGVLCYDIVCKFKGYIEVPLPITLTPRKIFHSIMHTSIVLFFHRCTLTLISMNVSLASLQKLSKELELYRTKYANLSGQSLLREFI